MVLLLGSMNIRLLLHFYHCYRLTLFYINSLLFVASFYIYDHGKPHSNFCCNYIAAASPYHVIYLVICFVTIQPHLFFVSIFEFFILFILFLLFCYYFVATILNSPDAVDVFLCCHLSLLLSP